MKEHVYDHEHIMKAFVEVGLGGKVIERLTQDLVVKNYHVSFSHLCLYIKAYCGIISIAQVH